MNITFTDDGYAVAAANDIDAVADAARMRVVVDPVRMKEYEVAEEQAKAYKARGYDADVPPYVASWALAKAAQGWTNQQACDDILAASARWNYALAKIRELRLVAKEAVKLASSSADVDTIVNQFKATLGQLMQGVQ
jgi:hypothetical protein